MANIIEEKALCSLFLSAAQTALENARKGVKGYKFDRFADDPDGDFEAENVIETPNGGSLNIMEHDDAGAIQCIQYHGAIYAPDDEPGLTWHQFQLYCNGDNKFAPDVYSWLMDAPTRPNGKTPLFWTQRVHNLRRPPVPEIDALQSAISDLAPNLMPALDEIITKRERLSTLTSTLRLVREKLCLTNAENVQ